jgi:hypothetical protein
VQKCNFILTSFKLYASNFHTHALRKSSLDLKSGVVLIGHQNNACKNIFVLPLGNCFDRAPQTPTISNFFRDTPNAWLIMSNHERKHVRASRHEVKLIAPNRLAGSSLGCLRGGACIYGPLPQALIVHVFLRRAFRLSSKTHPCYVEQGVLLKFD